MVRGSALAGALALHGLLLIPPPAKRLPPAAVETLDVTVVAQGDATTDTARETQSSAEVAPPSEPEPAPQAPEPPPTVPAAEVPLRENPTAPALPVRKPAPPAPPQPRPRAETRPVPKPTPKPAPARRPVPKPSAASTAQHRSHAGAERGAVADAGQAVANYGARAKAEINRHKAYPAAARDRQAAGTVVVTFLVGPSGRVASASVSRSSGDAALDGAALQAVRAASLPPPPGGRFGGRIAIDFSLRH